SVKKAVVMPTRGTVPSSMGDPHPGRLGPPQKSHRRAAHPAPDVRTPFPRLRGGLAGSGRKVALPGSAGIHPRPAAAGLNLGPPLPAPRMPARGFSDLVPLFAVVTFIL